MVKTSRRTAQIHFRERVYPRPVIFIVELSLVAMVAIAYGAAISLPVGVVIFIVGCVLLVGLTWLTSPLLEVRSGASEQLLTVNHCSCPVTKFGQPKLLTETEVEAIRRGSAHTTAFNAIRGGSSVVLIPLKDPDDPHEAWILSSRHPEKFIEVLGGIDRG